MIRIDMSEYMEKYSVSRLIGAPPGYVGYDEGGQLTEAVRRKPYSVVLFDETALLRRSFRPEFLNRIDETVFYRPLTKENIYGIVDLLVADLEKRLSDKRIGLRMTDAAKDFIISSAYDPTYGARPLKRFIQSRVETLIARKIIAEDLAPDTVITVDAENGELIAK